MYSTAKDMRDELQKGLEAVKEDIQKATEDVREEASKLTGVPTGEQGMASL